MSMFAYGDWAPYTWHVECEDCNYLGPGDNKLMAIRRHNEQVSKIAGVQEGPANG